MTVFGTNVVGSVFAFTLAYWEQSIVKLLAVLVVIPVGGLLLGYVFLMKMMSHMQSRFGPMDPGGFHGWYQNIGDAVKFIQKEDIVPARADRWVFSLAPYVVVMSTFLLYLVIPAGPDLVMQDLDVGIFYALAVGSIGVLGVLMAGWASANKYSLMGALRAAGQLIAYELPLVLAVLGVVIQAGTMSLTGIVEAQRNWEIFGVDLAGMPFVVTQFVGFGIFMVAAQAELTQAPFDMPVAESELVTGYMTEYSGFRFLSFFLGEMGSAFALSGNAATLFLGGWYLPMPTWWDDNLANVLGPGILLMKILLVSFLIFWFRFTYPRLREDQLQAIAWKYLIPLSLVNIMVTAILKVVL
jgi:NADH-quinone oxidoreductase subunit H